MANHISYSRMLYAFEQWKKSDNDSIFKAYKSPSWNKQKIWWSINSGMVANKGHDLRVISHTCYFFTCGYIIDISETEKRFVYFTPCNSAEITLFIENGIVKGFTV